MEGILEGTQSTPPTEWQPSTGTIILWNLLALVLFIVSIGIFGAISSDVGSLEVGLSDLLLGLLLTFVFMTAHEFVHGLVMQRFGGSPKYGMKMLGKVFPVAYATSVGTRFDRRAFVLISIAPLIVITILGIGLMLILPGHAAIPLALAVHTAGCIGDLGMIGVVFRQPAGTTFEDMITGIRFHPAAE